MATITWLDELGTELLYRTKCPFCGRTTSAVVDSYGMALYNMGGKIQECFPTLSNGQREVLLSGSCDECWNNIFGGDN